MGYFVVDLAVSQGDREEGFDAAPVNTFDRVGGFVGRCSSGA